MEAVKQNCWAIKFASEKLKDDKDIVSEAVKQNGKALIYASKEFQIDIDIIKQPDCTLHKKSKLDWLEE